MNKSLVFFGLLILTVYSNTLLKVIHQKDTPVNLKQGIEARIADFGLISYSDYHRSYFSGSAELPHNYETEDNINGCKPYQVTSQIVVVERGGCYYEVKAQNALFSGAKYLVMVNDRLTDSLDKNLIIANTDRSYPIGIVMVYYSQGMELINLLRAKQQETNPIVQVAIVFDKLIQKKTAEIDFWFSSIMPYSYDAFDYFKEILVQTPKDKINFNFHAAISGHGGDLAANIPLPDPVDDHCYFGGKYCSGDPDGVGPLNGKDTLNLDIKFLCIDKHYGSLAFLKVAQKFHEKCIGYNYNILSEMDDPSKLVSCFENQVQASSTISKILDLQKINTCHSNSFIGSSDNTILQINYETKQKHQVYHWPYLKVNGVTINGDLRNERQLEGAICASYKDNKVPDWCGEFVPTEFHRKSDNNILTYVLIILGSILFIVLTLFCIRRRLKSDSRQFLQSSVNQTMDTYLSMQDTKL